jgi:septation ring formation regulator EzrA
MDQETKQEFQNISQSIETLTSIVKQNFSAQVDGFVKVDARFEEHDQQLTGIKERLDKHDEDIENLAIMTQRGFDEFERKTDDKFDIVNHKLDQIQTNLDAFVHLHSKVDTELTIAQHNIQELDSRVTVLEAAKA